MIYQSAAEKRLELWMKGETFNQTEFNAQMAEIQKLHVKHMDLRENYTKMVKVHDDPVHTTMFNLIDATSANMQQLLPQQIAAESSGAMTYGRSNL